MCHYLIIVIFGWFNMTNVVPIWLIYTLKHIVNLSSVTIQLDKENWITLIPTIILALVNN